MGAVAYIELVIFVRVLFGAITLQNSLLSPIVYAHFLRQRYYQSVFTRDALAVTNKRLDRYLRKYGNPTIIMVWEKARMLVIKWAGFTIEPQNPAGAGAARR